MPTLTSEANTPTVNEFTLEASALPDDLCQTEVTSTQESAGIRWTKARVGACAALLAVGGAFGIGHSIDRVLGGDETTISPAHQPEATATVLPFPTRQPQPTKKAAELPAIPQPAGR